MSFTIRVFMWPVGPRFLQEPPLVTVVAAMYNLYVDTVSLQGAHKY